MCKYDVIHKAGNTYHYATRGSSQGHASHAQTFGEDRTCSSGDMIADRQTHTQTSRQTDRHARHNTSLPYRGQSNKLRPILTHSSPILPRVFAFEILWAHASVCGWYRSNRNCLLNTPSGGGVEITEHLGQRYSVDKQCQIIYGPQSFYCAVSYLDLKLLYTEL